MAIQMLAPPPPILKAFELKTPPPLPELAESETIKDHTLLALRLKDSGPAAWRARIAGRKATKQCPKTGVKAIYAATEELLREAVEAWLECGTQSGEEDSEPRVEQEDCESTPRIEPEDCGSTPRAGTEASFKNISTVECVRSDVEGLFVLLY